MRFSKKVLTLGAAAALSVLGGNANGAGSAAQNVNVNAAVQATCKFTSTVQTISLITDPSLPGPYTGTGTVTYKCTKKTTPTLSLTPASTALPSAGAAGGSANLQLALETDIPYSYTNTGAVQGTGFGNAQNKSITVNVSVLETAGQDASAGTYTDTIAVTLNF